MNLGAMQNAGIINSGTASTAASTASASPVTTYTIVETPPPVQPAGKVQLMVNFELGSDQLTFDSVNEINNFAATIAQLDSEGSVKDYLIGGHTDSSGGWAINMPLSERRANAVREALIGQGVDGSRLVAVGYASDSPVDGFDKSNPLNRRVEAVVLN
ncbi:MAG: OmpA family protein [Hellea sp.]|nr:OmpA family protein [Hellea sp.]